MKKNKLLLSLAPVSVFSIASIAVSCKNDNQKPENGTSNEEVKPSTPDTPAPVDPSTPKTDNNSGTQSTPAPGKEKDQSKSSVMNYYSLLKDKKVNEFTQKVSEYINYLEFYYGLQNYVDNFYLLDDSPSKTYSKGKDAQGKEIELTESEKKYIPYLIDIKDSLKLAKSLSKASNNAAYINAVFNDLSNKVITKLKSIVDFNTSVLAELEKLNDDTELSLNEEQKQKLEEKIISAIDENKGKSLLDKYVSIQNVINEYLFEQLYPKQYERLMAISHLTDDEKAMYDEKINAIWDRVQSLEGFDYSRYGHFGLYKSAMQEIEKLIEKAMVIPISKTLHDIMWNSKFDNLVKKVQSNKSFTLDELNELLRLIDEQYLNAINNGNLEKTYNFVNKIIEESIKSKESSDDNSSAGETSSGTETMKQDQSGNSDSAANQELLLAEQENKNLFSEFTKISEELENKFNENTQLKTEFLKYKKEVETFIDKLSAHGNNPIELYRQVNEGIKKGLEELKKIKAKLNEPMTSDMNSESSSTSSSSTSEEGTPSSDSSTTSEGSSESENSVDSGSQPSTVTSPSSPSTTTEEQPAP
ncbi:Vmc-like lipoprotein signal peptide domain-containing protein [Mycoplasma tauri]|uniref:Vmc-like lipoprotein signal peptide domain-containing protein n=1 Tax=Mycoplasma tauri TaxID=547987 RepID=UPI001CBAFACA|nr:hypothetical protein [Mycoplasma tauri]MBZ4203673.1 hypothetical protein [Mycoplasma tauri]